MSLWEINACIDGYAKSQGAEETPDAPTPEEHIDLVRRVRERRTVH